MKTITKLALIIIGLLMAVPEADAVLGVRRRTACRTAVVVGSSVHAADMAAESSSSAQAQQQTAQAQSQTAEAQKQTAQAQQQTAEAQKAAATPPPATPTGGKKLPIGTVVNALPPGAVSTPVNGVEYYYSQDNFYRAVFQGNTLVYVTADPTK